MKKYITIKVENTDLKYGQGTGVSLKQAQDAYISGFMSSARKHKNTKYKGSAGFDFEFY